MKKIGIFFFMFCLQVSVHALDKLDVDAFIQKNSCRGKIEEQLTSWEISNDPWSGVLNTDDQLSYVHSTAKFGVWIVFEKKDDELIFSKITSLQTLEVRFNKKCEMKLKVIVQKNNSMAGTIDYDDAKVFNFVHEFGNGLIYFWSPGMGLSVKGIKVIEQVAKDFNLPILFLADRNSSDKDLQEYAKKNQIDFKKLRRNTGIEFYFRRAHIHFPNLIVFKNGKIVNGMYPGLSSDAEYKGFIVKQMGKI